MSQVWQFFGFLFFLSFPLKSLKYIHPFIHIRGVNGFSKGFSETKSVALWLDFFRCCKKKAWHATKHTISIARMLKLCLTLTLQRDGHHLLLEVAHSPLPCFIHLYRIYREGIRYIREKIACLFDFPTSNDGYIHSLNFLVYPFHHWYLQNPNLKIYISAMSHKGLYLDLFHVIKKTYWVWSSFQIYS